jgi:hypothetical protein
MRVVVDSRAIEEQAMSKRGFTAKEKPWLFLVKPGGC